MDRWEKFELRMNRLIVLIALHLNEKAWAENSDCVGLITYRASIGPDFFE